MKELQTAIKRLQERIAETEGLEPSKLEKWSPCVAALQAAIDHTLSRIFGHETPEYQLYRRTVNWGEDIPTFGGETTLERYREDVTKGKSEVIAMLGQAVRSLQEELEEKGDMSTPSIPWVLNRKVFIVHGHDDGSKEAVARFVQTLGFEPIILHEQPNQGRTIIEKIEHHSDVGFAVVLLMPDDEGCKKGETPVARARQNVLLELGYFIAKLTRRNVCALKREGVEIPSDFAGVIWTPYDAGGGWRLNLAKELKGAGFDIDFNKVA